MQQHQNPFTTLYVTERMDKGEFPALFSPVLVPQALSLFQDGNVVVHGTQGTGKSMLLALLRTDIRLAFEETKNIEFPVHDKKLCQFISAGINLATNQALRFAYRWGDVAEPNVLSDLQGSFIDYVNTWILRDLLNSIHTLQISSTKIWENYQLGGAIGKLELAISSLGDDPVVSSLLERPQTLSEAHTQLSRRIEIYLKFLNGNLRVLPDSLKQHQFQAIGHPIAAAVNVLKKCECLADSTRVLVTIDQFEQLMDFETQLKGRKFSLLREAIDEAVHLREPTVCYRIGTRPHAWRNMKSEVLRDYIKLDIDELLRRKEHSEKTLFPALAKDVFRRRLQCFGYATAAETAAPMKTVFGKSPSPTARIDRISDRSKWKRLLKKLPTSIPAGFSKLFTSLVTQSPLSAMLGLAWIRQQSNDTDLSVELSGIEEFPWEQPAKKWWKKERIGLATLQMAAACGQRVPMFGETDILNLSSANILVFGSICQHVWACWIRSNNGDVLEFPIPVGLQDEGIRNASREWHKKIAEEAWLGDSLTQFIDVMGNYLHGSLISDKAMSYPGGNGISLSHKDLLSEPEVQQILQDGTDRGFLLERRHTPKSRTRGESTKWYLHPVLSPHYELTVGQTKEPLYVHATFVRGWMEDAGIAVPKKRLLKMRRGIARQRPLPGFEEEE